MLYLNELVAIFTPYLDAENVLKNHCGNIMTSSTSNYSRGTMDNSPMVWVQIPASMLVNFQMSHNNIMYTSIKLNCWQRL